MPTRVLIAPRNISGQATQYARAVAPLGIEAEVWSYGSPAFGFDADRVIDPDRLLADPGFRWSVLREAIDRFDVFHFQYARSLLPAMKPGIPELWDLPLLSSLGKKVVMHFRGSDVRLPSVHRQLEPDSYFRQVDAPIDETRLRNRVVIARRYCTRMLVSTPGLLDYVPDAVWLPHVVDVEAWAQPVRPEPRIPLVAHIPSSRATKASDVVVPVLASLEDRGLVRGSILADLDRTAMRAALQDADIVVDSLTIGDHGLTSIEAMASGAIAVGHIRTRNRERNPGVPVVEATVHTLEDVLADLATDSGRRAELRAEGRAWVRARHHPDVVGPQLVDIYEGRARPMTGVHPDWPRSSTTAQVAALERQLEEARAAPHGLVAGLGPGRQQLPEWAVARFAARLAALEVALADAAPGHRLLTDPDQVDGPGHFPATEQSLREVLRRHPRLHRLARQARRRLQQLRR